LAKKAKNGQKGEKRAKKPIFAIFGGFEPLRGSPGPLPGEGLM